MTRKNKNPTAIKLGGGALTDRLLRKELFYAASLTEDGYVCIILFNKFGVECSVFYLHVFVPLSILLQCSRYLNKLGDSCQRLKSYCLVVFTIYINTSSLKLCSVF